MRGFIRLLLLYFVRFTWFKFNNGLDCDRLGGVLSLARFAALMQLLDQFVQNNHPEMGNNAFKTLHNVVFRRNSKKTRKYCGDLLSDYYVSQLSHDRKPQNSAKIPPP